MSAGQVEKGSVVQSPLDWSRASIHSISCSAMSSPYCSIQFADTGWTGDIYLCQIIANYVKADEHQALVSRSCGPHLCTDPAVAVTELNAFATATGRQIAACFALAPVYVPAHKVQVSPSTIRMRLSPRADFRDEFLCHGGTLAQHGEGFQNHTDIRVILAYPERWKHRPWHPAV